MRVLEVSSLRSVPERHRQTLFEAMTGHSNQERLTVCLFFLSDYELGVHLPVIERNLRKMFPPSLRTSLTPERHEDFQAAAVRGLLNAETAAVRSREIAPENRLWEKTMRGHWRNTDRGNRRAIRLLEAHGLLVRRVP